MMEYTTTFRNMQIIGQFRASINITENLYDDNHHFCLHYSMHKKMTMIRAVCLILLFCR